MTLTGITASNKVYDGTTDATVDTTNAAFVGVVPGDDVSVGDSGTVTFDNKDVGDGQDRDVQRPVTDGGRRGELHPDAADSHREHLRRHR